MPGRMLHLLRRLAKTSFLTYCPRKYGKTAGQKNITFVVTKDCQLACKYCYLPGKTAGKRMSWDTAKAAVDFLLAQTSREFDTESVVFDFIGGEPLLEIDLIDRVCDYIKRRMFELDHPWFNLYRFSISTNGINYHTPRVREFVRKTTTTSASASP